MPRRNKMGTRYILDGHMPVEEPDIAKWKHWYEKADRIVRRSGATVKINGRPVGIVTVSTVFIGLDHSFGGGEPVLFETMVFGGPLDGEMDRCSTWEGAEKMHELMCERVKRGEDANQTRE